jgi:DNA-binding HxlR family transcriptional regulator
MADRIIEIHEACRLINEILAPLEKDRRIAILKVLKPGKVMTFAELQADTGIPGSSLHDHLKILAEQGYIKKTDERPVRYLRSEYVDKLCELAEYLRARKVDELTKKLSKYQNSDELTPTNSTPSQA